MSEDGLSVIGLEDKEDRVYVFGISSDVHPDVREWFLQEEIVEEIDQQFDYARIVVLPLDVSREGELSVEDIPVQPVELHVSEEFADESQNETEES